MKVLLTGAAGQLGKELLNLHKTSQADDVPHLQWYAYTHQELDITDKAHVMNIVQQVRPDVIINTSAYTDVDGAESHLELAYQVNAMGAKHLAEAANFVRARMCHISTDYVFDGEGKQPYEINSSCHPKTVYGHTKWLGEQFVEQHCTRNYIVRTSWLYGAYGRNFVHTMLQFGMNPAVHDVRVVSDQTGCPTWTYDLACRLLDIIHSEEYGLYHVSNSGATTWYAFAQEIFRLANIDKPVIPVTSAEFPRPAHRPMYSVLGTRVLKERGFQPLRRWNEALAAYFEATKERHANEDTR